MFVEVIKLRKSRRIENIMKKRKDESSSTDIIEPTLQSQSTTCSHKRKLSKSKRDEIHGQSKKKCKK